MKLKIAISTNWNVHHHKTGESLVDEALELGFDALELGYNTTEEIAKGVRHCIHDGRIEVDSVHAYCPVPFNAPHGYPELHLLASMDEDDRAMAALLLKKTLTFAQTVNAKAIVLHAGRIYLNSWLGNLDSNTLSNQMERVDGNKNAPAYQRFVKKAWKRRASRAKKMIPLFRDQLERVLPTFDRAGVLLCLENLPSIEAYPDEEEVVDLMRRFEGSPLRYWHDMGHGQVRENMGWISDHVESARKLLPYVGGIHIHDCAPMAHDHLAPGEGSIDFAAFRFFAEREIIRVFEPSPKVPPESIKIALRHVRDAWA